MWCEHATKPVDDLLRSLSIGEGTEQAVVAGFGAAVPSHQDVGAAHRRHDAFLDLPKIWAARTVRGDFDGQDGQRLLGSAAEFEQHFGHLEVEVTRGACPSGRGGRYQHSNISRGSGRWNGMNHTGATRVPLWCNGVDSQPGSGGLS